MKTQTIRTLEARHVSKNELFQGVRDTFDYALPQDWLNDFSRWCARTCPNVTYDLIRSTTVWVYPPGFTFGYPLTACTEVQEALDAWEASETDYQWK